MEPSVANQEKVPVYMYAIVASLIFLIILFFGLNYLLSKGIIKNRKTRINDVQVSRLNNNTGKVGPIGTNITASKSSELAQQAIISNGQKSDVIIRVGNWLNKTRDANGLYYNDVLCSTFFEKSGVCDKTIEEGTSSHEVLSAIWGRYKTYKKYHDTKDLQVLENDLDLYGKRSVQYAVQNDFWNCNMMYEMWQDKELSDNDKTNISNICWNGLYTTPKGGVFYTLSSSAENVKKELGETIAPVNLESNSENGIVNDLIKKNINIFSAYPSDFAARYQWKLNQEDMNLAVFYFNQAATAYLQDKSIFETDSQCLLGNSSLDMYKITKKQEYLNFAQKIVSTNQKDKLLSPVCGIFYSNLAPLTNKPEYTERAASVKVFMVDNFYDDKHYKNYLVDDGAFFGITKNGNLGLHKSVRVNGLMLGFLSI